MHTCIYVIISSSMTARSRSLSQTNTYNRKPANTPLLIKLNRRHNQPNRSATHTLDNSNFGPKIHVCWHTRNGCEYPNTKRTYTQNILTAIHHCQHCINSMSSCLSCSYCKQTAAATTDVTGYRINLAL